MKEEIRRAIKRVCNFLEDEEKTDYFCMKDNREDVSDHIYEQVMAINMWLGSTDSRTFPLQADLRGSEVKTGPLSIPWAIAEEAYAEYHRRYGNNQSLAKLAERGGFGWGEMDVYLPGWRDRVDLVREKDIKIRQLREDIYDLSTGNLATQHRAAVVNTKLRKALKAVNKILTVPAAEYVPAIQEAFEVIDRALKTDPIESHCEVYYSEEHDNYYCSACRRGMGEAYYLKHRKRGQSSLSLKEKGLSLGTIGWLADGGPYCVSCLPNPPKDNIPIEKGNPDHPSLKHVRGVKGNMICATCGKEIT